MSRISEAFARLLLGASDSRSASRPEAPGLWNESRVTSRALGSLFASSDSRSASRPLGAEEKATATGPLIAYENLGEPVWAPRDYAAFAREGFMQNAIVYRSVRMIAEAAASIPLLLYEGLNEIETHPLLDLSPAKPRSYRHRLSRSLVWLPARLRQRLRGSRGARRRNPRAAHPAP
jgi:hypothetical protein